MKKLVALTLGAALTASMVAPVYAEATTEGAAAAAGSTAITAHKANGIAIDGSLEDWNLDTPAVVNDATQLIRDAVLWTGPDDCSANFYLSWDEDNLYMAAQVTEDTPLGAIEMLPIDGEDNLKLYISTNPASDPARTEYDTNDFLVYFVMDEGYWDTAVDRSMIEKEKRQRYVSVGMDGGEAALDGYECAVQMTTSGFDWEAVIPWSCFSNKNIEVYAPQVGDELKCDFAITDISYPCPGTEYIPQMAWTGNNKINSDPSGWGTVTLAE